jgi:predicted N-acetyltransferase YhbS
MSALEYIGIAAGILIVALSIFIRRARKKRHYLFIPSGQLDRYSRTGFFSSRTSEKRGSANVRS